MQKSALCSILFCSGSMVKQKVADDMGDVVEAMRAEVAAN
jgi:hypothetical protein